MVIPIVMLGADLHVRRFTPAAAALLNLIATDVGRPFADLKPNIDAPELGQWISSVTQDLVPVHRTVMSHAGREYDLHIKPYRSAGNRIDGVVLTMFDRGGQREKDAE